MAQNIDDLAHSSGRFLKEDSTTCNIPDFLEGLLGGESEALITEDLKLEAIHLGNSFTAYVVQEVSDIGDQTIIAFLTGAMSPHLQFHYATVEEATVELLEAPVITNNTGTSVQIFNRNRSSANTSTVIDTSTNPNTVGQATRFDEVTQGNVAGGTEIWSGQSGQWSTGEGYATQNEWVLLPNTAYAIVIESQTNNDNRCLIRINWVEH